MTPAAITSRGQFSPTTIADLLPDIFYMRKFSLYDMKLVWVFYFLSEFIRNIVHMNTDIDDSL